MNYTKPEAEIVEFATDVIAQIGLTSGLGGETEGDN